jgi:hypothetical protein
MSSENKRWNNYSAGDWSRLRFKHKDLWNELGELINSLSPEQRRQVRNANYWLCDQLNYKASLEWKIKVLKAYKEVLNKRPGI